MIKKLTLLASSILLSASAFGSNLTLSDLELRGDCEDDDIRIEEENGRYFLAADFTTMESYAAPGEHQKKRCTMNFNVDLPYNYRLDLFQFSVDGIAETSETGLGRLTISHRVLNGAPARTTYTFREDFEDFSDLTGEIFGFDLPSEFRECGASIPMKTSVITSARSGSNDELDTFIDIDQGVSSDYLRFCEVVINPCY